MDSCYPLEGNEERVKPGDHFLGFVLVAIRREISDVAEQHCDVIVAARNDRADISNLLGGSLGKQAVEQFIGLLLNSRACCSAACRARWVLTRASMIGAENGLWT